MLLSWLLGACVLNAPAARGANLVAARHEHQLQSPTIHFIQEFAKWRNLNQLIVLDYFTTKDQISYGMMKLTHCLSLQGVYSSVHSAATANVKSVLKVQHHNVGVVLLLNQTYDYPDLLQRAGREKYFGEHHVWLIIAPNVYDTIVSDVLRNLPLRMNSYMMVATATRNLHADDADVSGCHSATHGPRNTFYTRDLQNHADPDVAYNIKYYKNVNLEFADFYLLQVYKIQSDSNVSMVTIPLGFWGSSTGFAKVSRQKSTEERDDMFGNPLTIGVRNWVKDADGDRGPASAQQNSNKDYLSEILYFITRSINATVKFVSFTNVGTQNQDGSWNNLLGAVAAKNVDLAVENVEVSHEKLAYMSFTYSIMRAGRNIFMHQSEYSTTRDIFLTSFSPKLLLCVLVTVLVSSALMILINNVHFYQLRNTEHPDRPRDNVDVTEAVIWSAGVMSLQGTTWLPRSTSGMILAITSLLFAVVIYNSYAAFITSVLSIKQGNINSLDDIFSNGYQVGFVTSSSDEEYLQAQTNELSQIYIRGHAYRVDSIDEGLRRAANSKYALFASASKAKQALQVLNPNECRCKIEQFKIPITLEKLAFPMPKDSPYRKIINLNVLKIKETGALSKIRQLMNPNMPMCSSPSQFISAQMSDVLTAFKLLGIGFLACLALAIAELCWSLKLRFRKTPDNSKTLVLRNITKTIRYRLKRSKNKPKH